MVGPPAPDRSGLLSSSLAGSFGDRLTLSPRPLAFPALVFAEVVPRPLALWAGACPDSPQSIGQFLISPGVAEAGAWSSVLTILSLEFKEKTTFLTFFFTSKMTNS